jgi:hypothetical protein
MAKVTKSAVAAPAETPTATAAPAETPTAPAVAGTPAKKVVNIKEPSGADVFVRVMGADGKGAPLTTTNAKGEKVPLTTPQVKVIANLLEASPNNRLTRKQLIEKLPAAGLVTKQPVGRIVSYYQKPMIDNSIITVEKIAEAPVAAPAAV